MLRKYGHAATQSSVSRDLRELGVAKQGDRYVLPESASAVKNDFSTLKQFVRAVRRAAPTSRCCAPRSAPRRAWRWRSTRPTGPRWSAPSRATTRSSSPPPSARAAARADRAPATRSFRTLRSDAADIRTTGAAPIVLAYSGGLDTSFLVPWLKEHLPAPGHHGHGRHGRHRCRRRPRRSRTRSARSAPSSTASVDARAAYFEQVLRFLIMGNVRRGQLYPLCVGAERVMQAQTIARMARVARLRCVAHGCTAAGNDQVRFEVALRTLAPDLKVLAPVRDRAFKRPRSSST